MLSFFTQVRKVLKANLSEICETVFIKYSDYSKSIKHWALKDPEVRKVGALLLDNLKINKSGFVGLCPNVEKAVLVQSFKIDNYQKLTIQGGINREIYTKDRNYGLLSQVKQAWVEDMVFQDFGLEVED